MFELKIGDIVYLPNIEYFSKDYAGRCFKVFSVGRTIKIFKYFLEAVDDKFWRKICLYEHDLKYVRIVKNINAFL